MTLPVTGTVGVTVTEGGESYHWDGTRWLKGPDPAAVVPAGPAKLLADGSVQMDGGWTPVQPQDVLTLDYVQQMFANMPQPVLQSDIDQMVGVAGLDATGKLDPSVLPDEVQLIDEKNQPGGYAGLDVNTKINAAQLPAAWAIPRLVFTSQAAMLADSANHKTGDLILVQGDPVAANNGEFVVITDAPGDITGYKNMGSTVGVHRHTGGDVDVQLAGQTQDFQYFIDNFLGSNAPVGSIALWPVANPPTGWLLCNGAVFDRQRYPELATVLKATKVPQLENVFVRGASGTRRPMSQEGQSTARPHRSFAGAVSNRRTSGYVDSGRVNVSRGTVPCKSWGIAAKWTGGDDVTISAALTFGHAKSWSVNGQSGNLANRHVTGSLNDGGVIVNAGGDPETRPANTALWYIIKAHAEQHLPGGIVPIRYEGVATANQQLVTLNERGNQQLIVVVNGAVLPESAYTVRNDKVTITQPMTAGDKYSIINYAKGAADPHHVYHTQADMVADGANIKQGELCFVHGDTDAAKNGEYIPEIDTPAAIADFEHLGLHVSKHTHDAIDVRGVLRSDGLIPLATGFVPTNPLDVATKGYVDGHSSNAGAIIHHGTAPPVNTLGKNGDVYYEYKALASLNWQFDVPNTKALNMPGVMRPVTAAGDNILNDGSVTGHAFMIAKSGTLADGTEFIIGMFDKATAGKEYLWIGPKLQTQANWDAVKAISVMSINGQPIAPVATFSWADRATAVAPLIFEVSATQKGQVILLHTAHLKLATVGRGAAAVGEYDVYEKVAGNWIEHKPITSDGKIDFDTGYVPKNALSAATKGYVDSKTVGAGGGGAAVVHYGAVKPPDTLGKDGDLYFEHEAAIHETLGGLKMDGTGVHLAAPGTAINGVTLQSIDAMGPPGRPMAYTLKVKDTNTPDRSYTVKINGNQVMDDAGPPIGIRTMPLTIAGGTGSIVLRTTNSGTMDNPWLLTELAANHAVSVELYTVDKTAKFDMWTKVSGKWREHDPIQANGSVPMKAGWNPTKAQDVATKNYVDTAGGAKYLAPPPMAQAIYYPGGSDEVLNNLIYMGQNRSVEFVGDTVDALPLGASWTFLTTQTFGIQASAGTSVKPTMLAPPDVATNPLQFASTHPPDAGRVTVAHAAIIGKNPTTIAVWGDLNKASIAVPTVAAAAVAALAKKSLFLDATGVLKFKDNTGATKTVTLT